MERWLLPDCGAPYGKEDIPMALHTNPVNWFEIPVTDLTRATKFYESIFGIKLTPQEMSTSLVGAPMQMLFFPMERNAANAGGALMKSAGYTPSHQGTMVYFSVDDIDEVLRKVDQNGGKSLAPKTNIGDHGFIGLFQDSEGNRVGLHALK